MRVLLDNNLSPRLIPLLTGHGWDVVHVRDEGLGDAEDAVVMEMARSTGRVLISAYDTWGGWRSPI